MIAKGLQRLLLSIVIAISGCNAELETINDGRINEYSSLIKEFKSPGADYCSAPLWVWNKDVSKEMIDSNLIEFKKQGIEGAFIHPRTGLHVEYLSDEWFGLVAYAIEKARELGMNMWIYDEYVCPSGFAQNDRMAKESIKFQSRTISRRRSPRACS